MHDSQQIIKRFSTHIYLKDCKGIARLDSMRYSNPTLKRLMQVLVESNPEAGEEEWARYFIQVLRDSPKNYQILSLVNRTAPIVSIYLLYFKILCNDLLFAYLQPICFQAAFKVSKQLQWSPTIKLHYPIEECFIIASESVIHPLKLLEHFDLNLSSPLDAYALISTKRLIKNKISQEIKSKSIKLSGYGLLRNVTKKELETALTELAIQPKNVELYGLAWQAFKDIFEDICPVTSSNGSPRKNPSTLTLNDEQLNQIAASYNQKLHHLEIPSPPVNGQKIAKKLKNCIQIVQDYQNKTVISLDAPIDSTFNLLSNQTYDPLEEVIDIESEQELGHIREIILQAFAALNPLAKKTLMLWLGLGINQTDFLSVLNLQKQYQVTRQFQRYLKTILKAVVDSAYIQAYWRETTTKTAIYQSSREHLAYLKDYLIGYCQNFFTKVLEKIVQEEINRDKKNIVIQYLREINNQSRSRTKAEDSSTNSQSISGEFTKIKDMIQEKFVDSVESQLSIKLSDYSSSDKIISRFIDDWLQENKAILYYEITEHKRTQEQLLGALAAQLQKHDTLKQGYAPEFQQVLEQPSTNMPVFGANSTLIFPQVPQLRKVFDFIEANYHQPINLSSVAQAVGYSPAYLTDLVRRHTGQTVNRWIVERRMAAACSLLLETDSSVEQIATAVGYQNTGHFFRQFRQYHNTTPSAWRKAPTTSHSRANYAFSSGFQALSKSDKSSASVRSIIGTP